MVEFFLDKLLEFFTADLTYFKTKIPIFDEMTTILIAVGWALLMGNLVFQAVRSMLSGIGVEGEDPQTLFTRTFLFSFLLVGSRPICETGLTMTRTVMDMLKVPDAVTFTPLSEQSLGALPNAGWLVVIILNLVIFWQIFRLCLEVAERYVVLVMLVLGAPLAFGCGGSKSTHDIFTGWARMFASMCILMPLNLIFMKFILAALAVSANGTAIIPWAMLIVGIAKTARHLDGIITRIGLNPAMTGDALGSRLPGFLTMAVMRSIGGAIHQSAASTRGGSESNLGSARGSTARQTTASRSRPAFAGAAPNHQQPSGNTAQTARTAENTAGASRTDGQKQSQQNKTAQTGGRNASAVAAQKSSAGQRNQTTSTTQASAHSNVTNEATYNSVQAEGTARQVSPVPPNPPHPTPPPMEAVPASARGQAPAATPATPKNAKTDRVVATEPQQSSSLQGNGSVSTSTSSNPAVAQPRELRPAAAPTAPEVSSQTVLSQNLQNPTATQPNASGTAQISPNPTAVQSETGQSAQVSPNPTAVTPREVDSVRSAPHTETNPSRPAASPAVAAPDTGQSMQVTPNPAAAKPQGADATHREPHAGMQPNRPISSATTGIAPERTAAAPVVPNGVVPGKAPVGTASGHPQASPVTAAQPNAPAAPGKTQIPNATAANPQPSVAAPVAQRPVRANASQARAAEQPIAPPQRPPMQGNRPQKTNADKSRAAVSPEQQSRAQAQPQAAKPSTGTQQPQATQPTADTRQAPENAAPHEVRAAPTQTSRHADTQSQKQTVPEVQTAKPLLKYDTDIEDVETWELLPPQYRGRESAAHRQPMRPPKTKFREMPRYENGERPEVKRPLQNRKKGGKRDVRKP